MEPIRLLHFSGIWRQRSIVDDFLNLIGLFFFALAIANFTGLILELPGDFFV